MDSQHNHNVTTKATHFADVAHMKTTVHSVLNGVASLDDMLRRRMRELEIFDGQRITLSDCNAIFDRGLVIGLIMAPFAAMGAFVDNAGREGPEGS
ncbi:hypothetical protein BST61_g3527 [Cercospora zeina]